MPRLIDLDVLLADIHNAMCADCEDECAACQWRDAIKFIEDAPTVGGWISVKSRMPEPPAQCLVYSDKSYRPCGMETATYTNMGWMTATYFPEITHWMPLPEAPEPPNGGDAG